MKNLPVYISIMLCFISYSCNKTEERRINITPYPNAISVNKGYFELNASTVFVSDTGDSNLDKIISYFAHKIERSTSFRLNIGDKKTDNSIQLVIDTS